LFFGFPMSALVFLPVSQPGTAPKRTGVSPKGRILCASFFTRQMVSFPLFSPASHGIFQHLTEQSYPLASPSIGVPCAARTVPPPKVPPGLFSPPLLGLKWRRFLFSQRAPEKSPFCWGGFRFPLFKGGTSLKRKVSETLLSPLWENVPSFSGQGGLVLLRLRLFSGGPMFLPPLSPPCLQVYKGPFFLFPFNT